MFITFARNTRMVQFFYFTLLQATILITLISGIDGFLGVLQDGVSFSNNKKFVLNAANDFAGQFPRGGEDAFAKTLEYLSPTYKESMDANSDNALLLEKMMATYRILDSEMVRSECSREAQEIVDELWRVIKLMYNGSSLQEAKQARDATQLLNKGKDDKTTGGVANEVYKSILEYLNPRSTASSQVDIEELKRARYVLDSEPLRIHRTNAQSQVVNQLARVVGIYEESKDRISVEDAIKKTWMERENAARGSLLSRNDS